MRAERGTGPARFRRAPAPKGLANWMRAEWMRAERGAVQGYRPKAYQKDFDKPGVEFVWWWWHRAKIPPISKGF